MPAAAQRTPAADEGPDLSHDWIVAASIDVDERVARRAAVRLSFRATENQRIDALEVYCKGCRRPWEDVADKPCEAKKDNSHLIGGDLTTRAARTPLVVPAGAEHLPPVPLSRRGMRGYITPQRGA